MNANTLCWLALVALTLFGFGMRPESGGTAAVRWLLPLAAIKSLLVLERFMELRAAHWTWRVGMWLLVATITVGLAVAR